MRQSKNITIVALCLSLFACEAKKPSNPRLPKREREIIYQGIITCTSSTYIESGSDEPYEKFGIVGMFPRYEVGKTDLVDNLLRDKVPQTDLLIDTCSQPARVLSASPNREPPSQTAIRLIDVGDLSVEYGDAKDALPSKTFPDLLKVIDGVIYSADEFRDVNYLPGETYTIRATGTDEVTPFEAVLQAPEELGEIKLNGVYPGDKVPVLGRGESTEVTWEGEGYGDEVILTINWSGTNLSWSMICRVRDDGHFVIPGTATKDLSDLMIGSVHEMNVVRIRQVSFHAEGLSGGEFSFVVSASFLIRFETNQ